MTSCWVIVKNSLPVYRQVTDRSSTVCRLWAKILKRKNTLLRPMSKPTKLTKSEEQLIVNPEVWINMEKKTEF